MSLDRRRSTGNANLQIGGLSDAIRENGVLGAVWHSRGYLPHFEIHVTTEPG